MDEIGEGCECCDGDLLDLVQCRELWNLESE